jgi:hypothetical protein
MHRLLAHLSVGLGTTAVLNSAIAVVTTPFYLSTQTLPGWSAGARWATGASLAVAENGSIGIQAPVTPSGGGSAVPSSWRWDEGLGIQPLFRNGTQAPGLPPGNISTGGELRGIDREGHACFFVNTLPPSPLGTDTI